MKIPYHYSLEVAHKVVDKINLSKKVAKNVCIQSMANGREQGLCIQVENIGEWKKICVAQKRGSDYILVVGGQDSEFDSYNCPSESVWANRVTFNPDKQKEAAMYIKKQIMECFCSPCPVPTDPEQRMNITCAHCGTPIDFRCGEVYINGPSYVCKLHAAN